MIMKMVRVINAAEADVSAVSWEKVAAFWLKRFGP